MLKTRISLDNAVKLYFAITAIALLYHLLILTQIVNYKNAWGGRLESTEQMYGFEAISITIQVIFAAIIYAKAHSERATALYKLTKILTFVIALIFLINTMGNIFAIQLFERVVFTPLTLIASLLAYRIASE